jgi:molybdopterin converting factor small subunit
MTIRIELYGRLRESGLGDFVLIEADGEPTAAAVLSALGERLGSTSLLSGVALATEDEVLALDARVPSGARVAALPPVCGG